MSIIARDPLTLKYQLELQIQVLERMKKAASVESLEHKIERAITYLELALDQIKRELRGNIENNEQVRTASSGSGRDQE